LTAGQALTRLKIPLVKGSIVNIRVDDVSGFLKGPATAQGLPHVLIGIYTATGQFYPAHLTLKDVLGSSYSITIPLNTALRLGISSKHVKLVDSSGTAIPLNGAIYPLRHDSGVDNSAAIAFRVTGSY
jgi:hypothetical protein